MVFLSYDGGKFPNRLAAFGPQRKQICDLISTWPDRLEAGQKDEIIAESKEVENCVGGWVLLQFRDQTGECFPNKCQNVGGALRYIRTRIETWTPGHPENEELSEMFSIVQGEVGRLTLRGRDDQDTFAVNMAQSLERSDYHYKTWVNFEYPERKWEDDVPENNLFDPEDPEGRIKKFWERFHIRTYKDCPCRQCWGEYCPPINDLSYAESERFDREAN